jgi:hypothetical protein
MYQESEQFARGLFAEAAVEQLLQARHGARHFVIGHESYDGGGEQADAEV